tara:strand:- start:916 stop:1644 length:729 start_codon:yes stop_codon:yes gene_type:complete
MENKFNVYVSTCKPYYPLIEIFAYLFNKFWDDTIKVIILGYEPYKKELPNNFKFVSMAPTQHSVSQWSTDIAKFMRSIDDEYVIFTPEDLLIYDKVDVNLFNKICKYLSDASFIGLTRATQANSQYKIVDNDFIELDQASKCRCSVIWGIWKRKYFLSFLNEGLTPWDVEGKGCEQAKNDGHRMFGTNGKSIIKSAPSAIRRGQIHKPLNFNFINESGKLSDDIIQEMIKLNYINTDGTIKQ